MSYIPLDDEDTRVIFAGEAQSNLGDLDASRQEQVLRRLADIASREAPPTAFVHESISNLDIITAGDQCRLYTKVVANVPRGNTAYHVIYILYIDDTHDYPQEKLATYDQTASRMLESVTALETVDAVEDYFEAVDALDEDDLRDLLD